MAAELYIARHGQNEDNAMGVLNGRRDLPLTDLGRRQAYDLASGIAEAGLSFDGIYSSPLDRARETASIIGRYLSLGKEPVIVPELIERDFGTAAGRAIEEAVKEAGDEVIKTDHVTYVLNFNGGETFPQTLTRARKALARVRKLQHEGKALLVCHGDIGKMLFAAATGKDWQQVLHEFHFGNCDLIKVGGDNDTHTLKLPQHNL